MFRLLSLQFAQNSPLGNQPCHAHSPQAGWTEIHTSNAFMRVCVRVHLGLYLLLSFSLSLPVRVNALKMLHKLLPKQKYVSMCVTLSLSLSVSLSPALYVCVLLSTVNARAAISRFVSSPSAKINMFVPGKTPLCHFSTFTLALQVRQAMPRPPLTVECWAGGSANANATAAAAAKVNALQENTLHTHRRSTYSKARAGCGRVLIGRRARLAHFATIKCHETLKVLSESANEAHETEAATANANEMQPLRERFSICCCCCCPCMVIRSMLATLHSSRMPHSFDCRVFLICGQRGSGKARASECCHSTSDSGSGSDSDDVAFQFPAFN